MFYNRNPSRLPFNQSSFSFRPLNWKFRGGGGPYRSHSELSRPQRVSSWPPGLNERGVRGEIREALACVAAFCLPGDRGPAEQPPPRHRQSSSTMGNKEVARSSTLARTHAIPLYLTQSTLYYLEVTRKKRGGGLC